MKVQPRAGGSIRIACGEMQASNSRLSSRKVGVLGAEIRNQRPNMPNIESLQDVETGESTQKM